MVARTQKAIQIFKAYLNDIGIFAFNNSSRHAYKTLDTLITS